MFIMFFVHFALFLKLCGAGWLCGSMLNFVVPPQCNDNKVSSILFYSILFYSFRELSPYNPYNLHPSYLLSEHPQNFLKIHGKRGQKGLQRPQEPLRGHPAV